MSELQIPVYGEKSSEDLSNTMSCLTGSKSVTSTTSNSSIEFMDVDDHETSKGGVSERVFDILDEVQASGVGVDQGTADNVFSDSEEEILPEDFEEFKKSGDTSCYTKEKLCMDVLTNEEYEDLPPGWVKKQYCSGIYFYFHTPTKIATTSRPYMLGEGSIKKHKLCSNAIPCLNFIRQSSNQGVTDSTSCNNEKTFTSKISPVNPKELCTDKESTTSETVQYIPSTLHEINEASTSKSSSDTPNIACDSDKLVTSHNNTQEVSNSTSVTKCRTDSVQKHEKNFVTHAEAVEYFKKAFRYKTIVIRKFSSWKMKRAYVHKQKCKNKIAKNFLTTPEGTVVLSVPTKSGTGKPEMQDWSLCPKGKSYVCILHEYLQRSLKSNPIYEFVELKNAKTPYLATIKVNGMKYGNGVGSSKKIAKSEAAKVTLEILLPQLKSLWNKNESSTETPLGTSEIELYSLFDNVKVTDKMVPAYCRMSGEADPYSMLRTSIDQNFDDGTYQKIKQFSKVLDDKYEFTMKFQKHSASVVCKSIKEGRQLASLKILQSLHPQVQCFGSLLRLYGNSVCINKEEAAKKGETKDKKKKIDDAPNFGILQSLREEMAPIYADQRHLIEKRGFVPPSSEELESTLSEWYLDMKRHKVSKEDMSTADECEFIPPSDATILREPTPCK